MLPDPPRLDLPVDPVVRTDRDQLRDPGPKAINESFSRSLCRRTDRDRGVLDIPSHSHTARGGHRLTRPLLRREHDIQEPLAHRLKAHTHLVRLIRRDLAQGVVEAVD